MSRIHEALQRAYLERGKMSVVPELEVADAERGPQVEVAPMIKTEIVVEEIKRNAWKPYNDSLPTLADRGAGVEQFRALRSHIYQARYEAPLKTILVASGIPSEGKSFVASNLAMSLARNSTHNILLIDGDLRRPTLHKLLGAPNEKGLSDYLQGSSDVNEILQCDRGHEGEGNSSVEGISNLTFIASGKHTEHSTELVASGRMKELIETVSPLFDWIVIDAPPVLVVTDGVELARAADAVLLVARGTRTPYQVAQRTQAAFGSSRILGFVLNDTKNASNGTSYRYNYYGTEAESGGQGARPR